MTPDDSDHSSVDRRAFLKTASATGLGLGWLVFFSNALSFAIGAVIAWLWSVVHKKSQESFNVAIASGLIAGESLIKALLAMLVTAIGLAGG